MAALIKIRWWQRTMGAMALIGTIAALAQPALAEEPTILLYGDSLLAGLGLSADESFMGQLQAAMDERGLAANLVNASVSGDTTADGLARLDWTLADPPDAVILGLGANDMLQGLPPAEARSNLEVIMARLDALDVPVLLLGMMANRGLGADYVDAFDATYPELAQEHDALLYPFFLEGVALDPALNQPDLRHPNAEGVAVIVAGVMPLVEALIQQIEP
ncbi:acyl-CoA thioesterase-1 [Devosia subaequoris]|uniref:Acyl-CoA thioesterase-1 n=1 Tax=Devosia subaequoris TaxID=395930 RepID=A0A7W6IKL1_9HYPH|nr:acyl-CoA thioesterase-1 [Devosia subaequoris]MCP1208944.1 arylesterase [Devosia subaequoris]